MGSERKFHVFVDHCRHYTPDGLAVRCDLGINIRKHVGGDDFGWRLRMPCAGARMAKARKLAHEVVPCDRMECPSAEEVARDHAELWVRAETTPDTARSKA